MATLVLLWPDLGGRINGPPLGYPASTEVDFVLSPDGLRVGQHGRALPAQLPRADTVLALLPARSLSWHRITLPKAPTARLREALGGLLEEQLLEDDALLHLALAPGARAGAPVWLAAMHKPALRARLTAWADAGLQIDRLVCALTPGADPVAHIHTLPGTAPGDPGVDNGADPDRLWLSLADANGAVCLPLDGGLARAKLAVWTEAGAADGASPMRRVTATPAAAAAAEAWLGQPVAVLSEPEHALAAARAGWELRQFDLAPSLRGTRAIANLLRPLARPEWRWARRGAVALVLSQIVGLNLWAWHQQDALVQRNSQMVELLKATHPQVRAVLDAPAQMAQEGQRLRLAAGVPGDTDLEPQLNAAAQAWPDGLGPLPALKFESGRLSLAAPGWTPEQLAQFRERLRPAGWRAEMADGQLTLGRAEPDAALVGAPATGRKGTT